MSDASDWRAPCGSVSCGCEFGNAPMSFQRCVIVASRIFRFSLNRVCEGSTLVGRSTFKHSHSADRLGEHAARDITRTKAAPSHAALRASRSGTSRGCARSVAMWLRAEPAPCGDAALMRHIRIGKKSKDSDTSLLVLACALCPGSLRLRRWTLKLLSLIRARATPRASRQLLSTRRGYLCRVAARSDCAPEACQEVSALKQCAASA